MEFILNALHFLGVVRRMIIYLGLRTAEFGMCCGKWKMFPNKGIWYAEKHQVQLILDLETCRKAHWQRYMVFFYSTFTVWDRDN